jgi:hypothetical protein
MHRRVSNFDSVHGGHARQLRLRPTALVCRRRTLIREKLGTEAHLAPRQIRERRLEADQWSDGQRVGVKHGWSITATAVLRRGLGV